MFNMFRGGKLDPMTLMAIDYEERRSDLNRIVRFIKHNCAYGVIDIDDIAAECGVEDLTPEEINYIEKKINER